MTQEEEEQDIVCIQQTRHGRLETTEHSQWLFQYQCEHLIFTLYRSLIHSMFL